MLARDNSFDSPAQWAARAMVGDCNFEPTLAAALGDHSLAVEHRRAGSAIMPPDTAPHLLWLIDGWTCTTCELRDGRRQIASFAVPGDLIRAELFPQLWTVRALTAVVVVDVGKAVADTNVLEAIQAAAARVSALVRARRYEHVLRLASPSPLHRIASLMIQLHDRLDAVGLVRSGEFAFPLRHVELADTLGLSTLHVTRCLKVFRERGLFTLQFRRVSGFDREGLLAITEG